MDDHVKRHEPTYTSRTHLIEVAVQNQMQVDNSRSLATRIVDTLNQKGADLGMTSIGIVQDILQGA